MHLAADTVQYIAIGAAAVAVISLLVGSAFALRIRTLRRAYATVAAGVDAGDLLGEVSRQRETVDRLQGEVTALRRELAGARADISDAIRHVAVVRFDAFDDMGGRLSFSAALLDDNGDGLVTTSIHARSETRTYAKGVQAGKCEQQLSPEEEQAIGYALRSAPTG